MSSKESLSLSESFKKASANSALSVHSLFIGTGLGIFALEKAADAGQLGMGVALCTAFFAAATGGYLLLNKKAKQVAKLAVAHNTPKPN
jgi:hypothetical protein